MNLSLEQGFVKREATSDDVLLIISTLWRRASDIHAEPSVRVAFHCALVLGAFGGFRTGLIENITYGQIEMALIRVQGSLRAVATITMTHNKMKELSSSSETVRMRRKLPAAERVPVKTFIGSSNT